MTTTTNETQYIAEPGKQELFIVREFDAPRELVFRAFTDPALYVQWLGPSDLRMTLETFEPERNGKWRYLHTDAYENVYAFRGVYHEVLKPELIISTFEFEGRDARGHVCLETLRFEALPGKRTRLTSQSVFQSIADRDAMLASGIEAGTSDSYNRLAALLQTMEK